MTNGEIPGSCGLVPEMTAMISQMANPRAALVAAIGGAPALRARLTRPQADHWRVPGRLPRIPAPPPGRRPAPPVPAAAHHLRHLAHVHYFLA